MCSRRPHTGFFDVWLGGHDRERLLAVGGLEPLIVRHRVAGIQWDAEHNLVELTGAETVVRIIGSSSARARPTSNADGT